MRGLRLWCARPFADTPGVARLAHFRLLAVLLLCVLPAASRAAADSVDSAMRCVHAQMTSSFLPVGVASEQIAGAAIARCFDEIETAATAIAGKRNAIDAARTSLRMQLYDYALQVAGATHAAPAYAADTADTAGEETPDASRSW
jgi:hypothetical protein